jgi:hypothetical protein
MNFPYLRPVEISSFEKLFSASEKFKFFKCFPDFKDASEKVSQNGGVFTAAFQFESCNVGVQR